MNPASKYCSMQSFLEWPLVILRSDVAATPPHPPRIKIKKKCRVFWKVFPFLGISTFCGSALAHFWVMLILGGRGGELLKIRFRPEKSASSCVFGLCIGACSYFWLFIRNCSPISLSSIIGHWCPFNRTCGSPCRRMCDSPWAQVCFTLSSAGATGAIPLSVQRRFPLGAGVIPLSAQRRFP